MRRIFVITISATKIKNLGPYHRTETIIKRAMTLEEVEELGDEISEELCPKGEGWFDHVVDITEVPREWYYLLEDEKYTPRPISAVKSIQ